MNENEGLIRNLRAMADFLERHELPEVYPPSFDGFGIPATSREDFAATARILAGADPTPAKKEFSDSYVEVVRQFGGLKLSVFVQRERVCRQIQTGTRYVEEQRRPAREEEIVPAHEEPIYEWKCEPLLGPSPAADLAAEREEEREW